VQAQPLNMRAVWLFISLVYNSLFL
jgi:hypothetical protein